MGKNYNTFNNTWLIIIILLSALSLIRIGLISGWNTQTIIESRYLFTYAIISLTPLLLILFPLLRLLTPGEGDDEDETTRTLWVANVGNAPLGRTPKQALLFAGVFTLAILIISAPVSNATGHPFIPVKNPYATEPLSQDDLDSHSIGNKVLNIGYHPMFEEIPIFIGMQITIWILCMILWLIIGAPTEGYGRGYWLAVAISIVAWAYIFAKSHTNSYGADQAAFIAAGAYMILAGTMNMTTGLLVSLIPHFIHNSHIAIFGLSIALSIGTATILINPKNYEVIKKWYMARKQYWSAFLHY